MILFWILNAFNKCFQWRYSIRYNRIDHFLRTDELKKSHTNREFLDFNIPDVGARVSVKDRHQKISPWKGAFIWHTSILYVSMLLLLIGNAIWQLYLA